MDTLHPDLARILVTEETIQSHVTRLAKKISEDYADAQRLYVVGVLKGAFIFLADLCRQLTIPHVVDFIAVSSYGSTTYSGAVRFVMDLREPIENEHVLIVEDIVDTGNTLKYLYDNFQGRKPASLKTCSIVQKKRDTLDVPIDYLGLEIPDVWVVGYGLDYADTHRTLPYIAELKPEVYEK
ncbi:MAG: hypoxanthine phosphoribosyltransferase [Chloroflexi bacterium]|nr:MAG: hypoxanthine phosphoribosyltransferase [Chloroflexota bacterium]